MKFSYKDLLPSYLDGPNIRRHGELVDMSTEYLYDQLGVLGSWNNLTRPVLIKKEQEEKWNATYTVYVDLPYAIQSITISGDYTATVSFSEEDCVTSYTLSFPFSVDPDSTKMIEWYGFANATFEVCVETYEGYTYKKGYPENDSIMGDVYDHDRLLDLLGTVLTIPRRIYSQFQANEMGRIADTVPLLFGKRMEQITTEFGTRWYVLSCTEDDYYYAERLQNFINDFMVEGLSLEKSKLRAVYDAIVTEELNFNDLVCHMDVDNQDVKDMACDDSIEANTYVYKVARSDYINLPVPVGEDLSVFLRDYVSVTKNVLVLEDYGVQVELLTELLPVYYTGEEVSIPLRVCDMKGTPLPDMHVACRMPNNNSARHVTGYTDKKGLFTYNTTLISRSGGTLTGSDLRVIVEDLSPYIGGTSIFPTTIVEPELIPLSLELELVSASTDDVTLRASWVNTTSGDPVSLTADVNLYRSTTLLNNIRVEDATETIISTPEGMTWTQGTTYTFVVYVVPRSRAPRGYKYPPNFSNLINVTIPGDEELLPVTLDATVTSATPNGVSVDVDFQNTSTSASISLDGTITMSINDGTTTTLLDTETLTQDSTVTLESPSGTTFEDGTYTLLLELNATNPPVGYYYNNPITASETITISTKTEYHVGKNTENPWTRDMLYRGEIGTSGDGKDALTINYRNTPCIIVGIPLTGDFDVTLHLWMDCIQSPGNFGFTTSTNSVNTELKVNQNNINNTISISNVFTTTHQIETIKIKREGTEYTYEQNGNTYTTTVSSASTVYFYMQKSGGCTLVLDDMTYII